MNNMLRSPLYIIFFLASMACACKGTNDKNEEFKDKELPDLKKGDIIFCGPPEGQFGTVEFNSGCSEKSRKDFNLAIALLHSFEYAEAEKAFAKVIEKDPDCAMAYWGVAMCNWHPLWEPPNRTDLEKGSRALAIAHELSNKSERESDYLNAIGEFYKDWQKSDYKTRTIAFTKAMEKMYEKYPVDPETAIFYSLALNAAASPEDKTYANQKKAVSILNQVSKENPNHPGIAHYIIHNYDYPELAILALPTARRYAAIAPSSAHAQHMPSHIFTRLGLWKEAISSNLASTESAKCYAESAGIKGHWDEELHGIDYLVYAYLQEGKDRKAKELVEYCRAIDSTYPVNFKVAYAFAAVPARYALELKLWDTAANLETQPLYFDFEKFPWERSIIHFARVLGAVHTNNLAAAKNDLGLMNNSYDLLIKSKNEYTGKQVLIQIKAANAWIKLQEGHQEEALKLMIESAEMEELTAKHPVTPGEVIPGRELLGDMLMELHKPQEALIAYELSLKSHPNRFNGLLGASMAAKESGEISKASTYFTQLLDNRDLSECKRSSLEKVKLILAKK